MTKKYKRIPITAAKRVSEKYDKEQVIIVAWDKKFGRTHITTYGETKKACRHAAAGAEFIKKALGWK